MFFLGSKVKKNIGYKIPNFIIKVVNTNLQFSFLIIKHDFVFSESNILIFTVRQNLKLNIVIHCFYNLLNDIDD